MKREEIKKILPILSAYAEGKTVQWKFKNEWIDYTGEGDSLITNDEWRIKPSPQLRPWKPEEVPVGALLTNKFAMQNHEKYVILSLESQGVFIRGRGTAVDFREMFEHWQHSLDGGKTWLPCGVEE